MKRIAGPLLFLFAACNRAPAPGPTASDTPAPQRDVVTARPDVPPPPPAERTVRAPSRGASADPPLRALDPRMEVPRWEGEGELTLTIPGSGDGTVRGTLRAGDLSLRVRGFRAGESVRATLEPEAVDTDASTPLWRGTLEATLRGESLSGTWTLSAEGGRLARTGSVGAR